MSQFLVDFAKEAFRAGKTRAETHMALREAGWPEEQLNSFWTQYADVAFPVPVPKPRIYVSPRYTALNLFFFLVLLLTIWASDSMIFTFLDYYLPDAMGHSGQGLYGSNNIIGRNIAEAIRTHLAMIMTCAPLTIVSSRMIRRTYSLGNQSVPVIRLKLIYLIFLCAAAVMLLDVILFVYYFLSVELSLRFILKMLVCGVTWAGLYYYFRCETGSMEKKA